MTQMHNVRGHLQLQARGYAHPLIQHLKGLSCRAEGSALWQDQKCRDVQVIISLPPSSKPQVLPLLQLGHCLAFTGELAAALLMWCALRHGYTRVSSCVQGSAAPCVRGKSSLLQAQPSPGIRCATGFAWACVKGIQPAPARACMKAVRPVQRRAAGHRLSAALKPAAAGLQGRQQCRVYSLSTLPALLASSLFQARTPSMDSVLQVCPQKHSSAAVQMHAAAQSGCEVRPRS